MSFDKIIAEITEQRDSANKERQPPPHPCDLLLQKLISGELNIENLDIVTAKEIK